MTAQLISSEAVAALLSAEEDGDADSARRLVQSLLNSAGLPLWKDMEIELFPGRSGTLLLARRTDLVSVCCCFPDLEALLEAVRLCSPALPARLLLCRGLYYLLLYCPADAPAPELNEFCLSGTLDAAETAHILEHGRTLIGRSAISVLQKNFF